jgi:heat shock protein HslJ
VPRRSLVLVALVTLTLVAAGATPAAAGSGEDPVEQPFVGTVWILDQRASRLGAIAPSVSVTAQFAADGRLTGNDGCNLYSTTFTSQGRRLAIDSPIGGTLVACSGAVGRVADRYRARLPKARSYRVRGSVFTVRTTDRPLVYRALDPEAAVAGDWEVTGYYRTDAIVSPIAGSTLTATFADGTISGDSGCNRYTGPYEVDDTKIAIGPLASTLRACADPAIDQQEREYVAALELARTFDLAGGNLTLLREDGGIAVSFVRS